MKRKTSKKAPPPASAAADPVAPEPGPADAAAPMRLEGDLTIYHAAELRQELLHELARGTQRFDLSGVAELDSAGLQLLAALRASIARSGGRAQFLAPSARVRDTLALCGLGDWLDAGATA